MSRVFVYIFGAVIVGAVLRVAADDRYCTLRGVQFAQGESITVPGSCERATCQDSATNSMGGINCPAFLPSEGCHLSGEDLSKPYPRCCPKEIC